MSKPKERILLVESDPGISNMIGRLTLRPMGYEVKAVNSSVSAMQEALTFDPDIILADLDLPGLSAKDLIVALSSQGIDIPVIVIAGEGREIDVIQAFRLGAIDFLSWPAGEAEVHSVVERVMIQVRNQRERERLTEELKRVNQDLQTRVRELTIIFAIGKAVVSTTEQQAVFNKIIQGAQHLTKADSAWLLIRDEGNKAFILKATLNVPESIKAKRDQAWDDGLSSLSAISGESLSVHGDPLKRFKINKLGQSALVVPVKADHEVIGLLVVTRVEAKPFNNNQKSLLEALADFASISLINARLIAAAQANIHDS